MMARLSVIWILFPRIKKKKKKKKKKKNVARGGSPLAKLSRYAHAIGPIC